MNNSFFLSYSELLEKVKELTNSLNDLVVYTKHSLNDLLENLSNEDNKKYSKEYLDQLTLEELEDLIFLYKGNNPLILKKILNYYSKRIQITLLTRAIKSYNKILKKLLNNKKRFLQNKREKIRKIYCFLFKNLDDTHTTSIFN